MSLRKIKKNVAENSFMFPLEMYTSLPGSIVVTSYILNYVLSDGAKEKPDLLEIRKKWKSAVRHGFDFGLKDPEYINKVCDEFGVEHIPLNLAAFVQSDLNALVVPYLEIEGEKRIMPLREDGYYSRTLRKGKIYPLTDKLPEEEKVV
jgi:hypothetical protein